jgi:hypothetical protein
MGTCPRDYIDDCLDEVHRVALGRPCPDRDHCRLRLLEIMRMIMVPVIVEAIKAVEVETPDEPSGEQTQTDE